MGKYLVIFLEALAISTVLTPVIRRLSMRLGFVDRPRERRIHSSPIPLMGGVAIYLAFVISAFHLVGPGRDLAGLILGGTIILILGVVDDLRELPAKVKFVGQVLAALVAVSFGIRIEFLTNPFGGMVYLGKLGIPLTVLWIVAIANVVNFIDGLDGLAAGVSSIAAFSLFAVAVQKNQVFVALLAMALAGGSLGFLRYNFNPAKIFMGDAGALFLGYTIGTMAVMGALKGTTTIALAIPAFALGVPILDTAFAIVRRYQNGTPFYLGDKDHVHHRLLALGLTQRQAVVVIYVVTGILGLSAVMSTRINPLLATPALAIIAILLILGARRVGIVETRHHDNPGN